MKKLIIGLLLALSISVLAGCGGKNNGATVNVASLKGPTTIGLVKLMDDSSKGKIENAYSFTMATTADEILPKVISGQIDIALVPANVAAVLYNKTEGNIKVIDINTLGVLYAVSQDSTIDDVSDFEGKTVYITNKGTTPDYVTQYLLIESDVDMDKVNIEYKSEATEVAAMLKENPDAIGILPQPFVTAALIQNENLSIVLDLNKKWESLSSDGSRLVTGVTIVRGDFLEDNEKAVKAFLKVHKKSVDYVNEYLDETASLVVDAGIIEKEPIAKKAIPNCNITYIDGTKMKNALQGYLNVLYEMDPKTVGGALPDEAFYY